jgi:hypothetical protein
LNPRPLGYEQADRRPSPSRPVAHTHAGLSRQHRAVSTRLTTSGSFRRVLVTITVTKAGTPETSTSALVSGEILQLGAEIEGPDRAELIARVGWPRSRHRQLAAERDARAAEVSHAQRRIHELEDDLTAPAKASAARSGRQTGDPRRGPPGSLPSVTHVTHVAKRPKPPTTRTPWTRTSGPR